MYEHQNVTSTLVFTIVFGTQYNFFIVLSISLENCRSSGFSFFTRQNVRARKTGRASEVLLCKSIDWFLYNRYLHHERVKT